MGYTIGKRMTAYPPRPYPDASGQPGLVNRPSVGSVLTMNPGIFHGSGSYPGVGSFTASSATLFNSKFQWFTGSNSVANATFGSFSVSSALSGITCRMSVWGTGIHTQWGTYFRDFATGPAF